MEKQKVLVVDDENDLREALASAISSAGYQCFEAHDGEEGLSVALREKPDLILLDIMMPKVDGHEMLKRLRQDDWGKRVKVIQLTAREDAGSITKSIVEGSDDYIMKSGHSLEEIVKKVKQHLVGYH